MITDTLKTALKSNKITNKHAAATIGIMPCHLSARFQNNKPWRKYIYIIIMLLADESCRAKVEALSAQYDNIIAKSRQTKQ